MAMISLRRMTHFYRRHYARATAHGNEKWINTIGAFGRNAISVTFQSFGDRGKCPQVKMTSPTSGSSMAFRSKRAASNPLVSCTFILEQRQTVEKTWFACCFHALQLFCSVFCKWFVRLNGECYPVASNYNTCNRYTGIGFPSPDWLIFLSPSYRRLKIPLTVGQLSMTKTSLQWKVESKQCRENREASLIQRGQRQLLKTRRAQWRTTPADPAV